MITDIIFNYNDDNNDDDFPSNSKNLLVLLIFNI